MSPPLWYGGMSSSRARRPYSAPMPVGPHILCPEQAKKSHPRSCTSTGMWGAACAPSTTQTAPMACALAAISRTGLTVPRAFETCVTATTRVRGERMSSRAWRRNSPALFIGMTRRFARFSWHRICHGTMFEWCSMAETMTSSPACTCVRPQLEATKLIPSVAPRVQMISSGSAAFKKCWTRTLAASKRSVARWLSS